MEKIITVPNTDNKVHKLVTVFATRSYLRDRKVHLDKADRSSAVNKITIK